MTRGWGEGRKNIRGLQTNFFLKFGSENKKKEKKGLHSQLRTVDTGRCLFSGHISRLGGHVHSLAGHDEIFLCGFWFFPTNSGMKTKKKSSARNLKLSFDVHLCFSSWIEMLLKLWGHKQYFGGHRSRNALQWHRVCYFLLGHNSRLGRQKQ